MANSLNHNIRLYDMSTGQCGDYIYVRKENIFFYYRTCLVRRFRCRARNNQHITWSYRASGFLANTFNQRRRRWANIEATLGECLVFSGSCSTIWHVSIPNRFSMFSKTRTTNAFFEARWISRTRLFVMFIKQVIQSQPANHQATYINLLCIQPNHPRANEPTTDYINDLS